MTHPVLSAIVECANQNSALPEVLRSDVELIGTDPLTTICHRLCHLIEEPDDDEWQLPFELNNAFTWCNNLRLLLSNGSALGELFSIVDNTLAFESSLTMDAQRDLQEYVITFTKPDVSVRLSTRFLREG
jgi:hypothetical protein